MANASWQLIHTHARAHPHAYTHAHTSRPVSPVRLTCTLNSRISVSKSLIFPYIPDPLIETMAALGAPAENRNHKCHTQSHFNAMGLLHTVYVIGRGPELCPFEICIIRQKITLVPTQLLIQPALALIREVAV